jgi:[acyl-carrier-protein] S-malonyltransferase
MKLTFIFPGQGSQIVGMGRDFYDNFTIAKQVFEEVDETLNQNLGRLIFEGPQDQLTLTENAQPALMVVSMAIVRVLESELGRKAASLTAFMAGHSLGEYTANCAAGTFTLADTARLLRLRGSAMQKAVPIGQGAMAAILNLPLEAVEMITTEAAQGQICGVANDNSEGQIVISGHKEAVDRAMALALERGAKRALFLPVSAPFHSSLMEPAAVAMEESLDLVETAPPLCPILANVTAGLVTEEEVIRYLLVKQVTGRVRWRESMLTFSSQGITHCLEIGAGKVLTGLVKRSIPEVSATTLNTVDDLKAFMSLVKDEKDVI